MHLLYRHRSSLTLALLLACSLPAFADEPPSIDTPEWQSMYDRVAASKDPANKRLAAKWKQATTVQNWTSSEGQRMRARFLQHPKQSDQVTFGVVKLTNGKKTEEVVALPLAKLNKQGQERVAQIDKLLEELGAAAGLIPEANPAGKPGPTPDTEKSRTDPTGRPLLKPGQKLYNTLWMPDNAKWRTDYNEFRKQFSASAPDANSDRELNFGNILPLQKRYEFYQRLSALPIGSLERQTSVEEKKAFASRFPLGDVVWECTMTESTAETDKGKHLLLDNRPIDLPPLPEPFRLEFKMAGEEGGWDNLRKRQEHLPAKIRFTGILLDSFGIYDRRSPALTFVVRFPDEQPGK